MAGSKEVPASLSPEPETGASFFWKATGTESVEDIWSLQRLWLLLRQRAIIILPQRFSLRTRRDAKVRQSTLSGFPLTSRELTSIRENPKTGDLFVLWSVRLLRVQVRQPDIIGLDSRSVNMSIWPITWNLQEADSICGRRYIRTQNRLWATMLLHMDAFASTGEIPTGCTIISGREPGSWSTDWIRFYQ